VLLKNVTKIHFLFFYMYFQKDSHFMNLIKKNHTLVNIFVANNDKNYNNNDNCYHV
jgi:hypothetical protein